MTSQIMNAKQRTLMTNFRKQFRKANFMNQAWSLKTFSMHFFVSYATYLSYVETFCMHIAIRRK